MAGKGLSADQKMEWAKFLFLREDLTYKDIALKVGVHEKTVAAWASNNEWGAMRRSLLTTKEEILRDLLKMLELMKNEAHKAMAAGNPKIKPNVDGIYKLAMAIRKLEDETGVGPMIATFKAFITYMLQQDFEMAQTINFWANEYVKAKLKND